MKIFTIIEVIIMKKVSICVGSSCHLKGAAEVVDIFKKLHKKLNLEDKVDLSASFCQGNCTNGVNVVIDGEIIPDVGPGNAEKIFREKMSEFL
ncbi:MAG: (2Fe-2S) ferredoxin domain-containing protein [Bacillota bacterium]